MARACTVDVCWMAAAGACKELSGRLSREGGAAAAGAFGNFSDPHRYAGFVPSERYLSSMLNKAIEMEEADANQHTSCLEPDQIAIDDSHKVNTMFESFCQCSILLSKMHIQGERAYCEGGWGACILGTLDLHDEPVYPKADIDTHKIT